MRRIAHRGGSLEAPENTLRAFRRAVALGCDAVELDLRATADGTVVVLHDPEVDRVTEGTGRVADLTAADLTALDAAHWFVPGRGPDRTAPSHPLRGTGDADLRIPTLADVLAALDGVPLVMDLKVGPPEVPGFVDAVAELLRARGRVRDVIVGSFSSERLDAFRSLAPGVPTSASAEEVLACWQGGATPDVPGFAAFQVPPRHGDIEVVTADLVARVHASGAQVHVWTVDEPAEMVRLLELGVDGIISDVPSVLVDVVPPHDAATPAR
jgi:glycerophosphoryl diester phosphodiesterase